MPDTLCHMYVERDFSFGMSGVGLVAFDPAKLEAAADSDAYLLDQQGKGYLWGLNLTKPVMNYGTPALTAAGNMYVPIGSSVVALKLQAGGGEPEVLWSYTTNGGVYPTVVHVLSDGTLVFGNSEGMLYFIKEKNIDNGGLDLEAAWPRPYHDNYRSNNAAHPMKWDRTKPAPYPSVEELLAGAPDGWNCNVDTRCFPKSYHETCEWGWPAPLESQQIPCTDPQAENIPCPDPRRYTCLAKDKVAVHPCDAPADTDSGDDSDSTGCNCATPGVSATTMIPWLGLLLCLGGLAALLVRRRRPK